MQKTKIDRWLCRKFVHINQIYFNTLPESLPRGIVVEESGKESGARFRYRAETRDEDLAQEVCNLFVSQNITFTSRVHERDTLLAQYLGNPKKSVTMTALWVTMALVAILFYFSGLSQMVVATMLQDKDTVKMQDKLKRDKTVSELGK